MSQGFLSRFEFGAAGMRRLFNIWPPFRAAGIRVREIAPDFRSATVELRMKLLSMFSRREAPAAEEGGEPPSGGAPP